MRLTKARPDKPGFRRSRRGDGFRFLDSAANAISDVEDIERIQSLAIPPAWEDVWIAPRASDHIQATGVDANGRTQYLYHPAWRQQRDLVKHDKILEFAAALPPARKLVEEDLLSRGPTAKRALAAGFRLLDQAGVRVGSERHTTMSGNRGLTTLLVQDITLRGDKIILDFPAKSGVQWHSETEDRQLKNALKTLLHKNGKPRGQRARLLAWNEGRRWNPVRTSALNEYIGDRVKGTFTAKDFRTLHGTITAAQQVAALQKENPEEKPDRLIRAAIVQTAQILGNTPTVAKSSYIDPRVFELFLNGETISTRGTPEFALLRLLENE
ncbi:DNA topoisomerase IB [Humidisolicoccus flavus]|uniref:DNA topoisomerase IB n=1 Tax=Humidisolicoccus flavus TaxID=3111414 RepID=UPI00324A893B